MIAFLCFVSISLINKIDRSYHIKSQLLSCSNGNDVIVVFGFLL